MMQFLNNIINKIYISIENDGFDILENIGNISETIFSTKPLSFIYDSRVEIYFNAIVVFLIFIFLIITIFSRMVSAKDIVSINIKRIIQAIIVCIICINSYSICKEIVVLNYSITNDISEILNDLAGEKIEYESLKKNISTIEEYLKEQDKISFSGVKDIIIIVVLIMLITVFSIRYVFFTICIIFAPFFVVLLLNKRTSKYFYLWLKCFISNLLVQNVNKIILFICICSKEIERIYGCILLGAIILIYRINKKVGEI